MTTIIITNADLHTFPLEEAMENTLKEMGKDQHFFPPSQ